MITVRNKIYSHPGIITQYTIHANQKYYANGMNPPSTKP